MTRYDDYEGNGEPAFPDSADFRVSNAERDATIELLQRHTTEGRLSVAEFSERLDEALHARTGGDLRTALRGLPGPRAMRRSPTPRVPVWALLVPLLLVLTFAAIAGHVWILFPLGWLLFGVLRRRAWHRRAAGSTYRF